MEMEGPQTLMVKQGPVIMELQQQLAAQQQQQQQQTTQNPIRTSVSTRNSRWPSRDEGGPQWLDT
eukprot:1385935-Amphidinium_carterae.2